MSTRVRKDGPIMAKWALSLATGKELENIKRKREEKAGETAFFLPWQSFSYHGENNWDYV